MYLFSVLFVLNFLVRLSNNLGLDDDDDDNNNNSVVCKDKKASDK